MTPLTPSQPSDRSDPPRRPRGFRRAMDGLHAWAGVISGGLLFAIFLMGTLAVFDREIDRWAQPSTRLAGPAPAGPQAASLDRALPVLERLAPANATLWLVYPPAERTPTLRVGWSAAGARSTRDLHPHTGALLADSGVALGTQLFYPFHYSLHWKWLDLGEWLVGLAAMALLVVIVSGVATHRRLFKDFFTWRPRKGWHRAALDLHNVSAVFALPFHFVIALSGLIVFAAIYLQPAVAWVYGGNAAAFAKEAQSRYSRAPAQRRLEHRVSLDTLAARARAHWAAAGDGGDVQLLIVRQPRDANAVVEVRRAYGRRLALEPGTLYFDAATGALLHAEALPPAARVQRVVAGLHLIQFDHGALRWLYFVMGLGGCVMLATGLIAWTAKRAQRHAQLGWGGAQWVQAATVATVCGLPLASTGVMLLNTLPPAWWTLGAAPLAAALRWFFGLWALCALHAALLRDGPRHWLQQCSALAAVAVAAVLANWARNGVGAWAAAASGPWAAPAVDLALLVVAAAGATAAWRLRRHARARNAPAAGDAVRWPLRWGTPR